MATASPFTPDLTATPATASTYDAEKSTAADWQVTPNQTVQSQVKDIIAENSPLMQQAETRALQQANQRGLMNSSLAVGAGQGALYDVATPIAQQDAQTFARSGEFNAGLKQQTGLANQQAANQALAQNAQLQTNVGVTNADQANRLTQIAAQQQGDLARIAASGALQQKLTEFSAGAAKELAGIEATYKNLTQASSSAASIMNTTMAGIARIMEDTSLDAAAKQKAIDIYNRNAATSLQVIGSLAGDVQLSGFMDAVLGPTAAATPATQPATTTAAPAPQSRETFDAAAYLQANPDVAAAGVDPWVHWTTSGYKEGRQFPYV